MCYASRMSRIRTPAVVLLSSISIAGVALLVAADPSIITHLRAAVVTTSVTVLPRTPPPEAPTAPIAIASSSAPKIARAASAATSSAVRLLFVGDIMPSRYVAQKMARNGRSYPFRDSAYLTRGADLAFANLESPVTPGRPIANSEMTFRTDPEVLPELGRAGFDVVSLANNHTPNWGEAGIRDTMRYLASSSIAFAGAGTTSQAYAPVFVDAGGMRVAIVAANDTDVVPTRYCASATRTGTACVDLARIASVITDARASADFVVFTMHAGVEYATSSSARQRQIARTAIDAGADAVIGHHPHVIQNEETYKGKPIFYSLGNFIFDQDLSPATQRGLVVVLNVSRDDKRIVAIERYRVRIEDYARPVVTSSSTMPF